MRRKGKKPFGRVLTDAAGIPPELVSSLPLLSMTGQEELFIENFKGILQYTDAVLFLLQTKACLFADRRTASFSRLLHKGCTETYRNHHQYLFSDQLTGGFS